MENSQIIDNNENLDKMQWYVLVATRGKENSIIQNLWEKIRAFGYEQYVGNIRIFEYGSDPVVEIKKREDVIRRVKNKTTNATSEYEPRNTKLKSYKKLNNDDYEVTTLSKTKNYYPGYIFIWMVMDKDVWYCIRNTKGIMGFVGPRGSTPEPISIETYQNIENSLKPKSEVNDTPASGTAKPVYKTEARIGSFVEIIDGSFAGLSGEVKKLDDARGIAKVEIELFGRNTDVDIRYEEIKLV